MRTLFWHRRNGKLVKRLQTVIETSERVRKSAAPKKRRVVIDTSLVDASGNLIEATRRADVAEFTHTDIVAAQPSTAGPDLDVETHPDDQQRAEEDAYRESERRKVKDQRELVARLEIKARQREDDARRQAEEQRSPTPAGGAPSSRSQAGNGDAEPPCG